MASRVGNPKAEAQVSEGTAKSQPNSNNADSAPKKQRVKRPNYNEIHAKPLPLEVYPLPTFIPHNPISIVRIAVSLISHSIRRPSSHLVIHKAYFSPETQSIHVTDPKSIRALWEQGFWGKGSLSRSEPHWLDQEKRRRGLDAVQTSEEYTRGRREERRQMKLERAKAQREAIEEQLRKEGKVVSETQIEDLVDEGLFAESPKGTLYSTDSDKPLASTTETENAIISAVSKSAGQNPLVPDAVIEDQEHLQLTLEEAFFLCYVLGVLEVSNNHVAVQPTELIRLFCQHSLFLATETLRSPVPLSQDDVVAIAPDNAFVLKYIVFHHFRSLGWVVRPGTKFGCDYLLYLRGPAFHHAEFAVMILPAYSHPYWSEDPVRAAASRKKENRDWWWLHRLNRVQTQARKTLMLVHVEVPPPWDENGAKRIDISKVLVNYHVRETIWKRWSMNRNRD
ncbi:hypothetical protein DM02DRAFT_615146 [Periconia macrospinosa]|uniref:tRNA-splicing endonuclease subunit Sen2 n=1 Tax=Periconia macrospinosa TaxID=97972 RepID=A0A2V1DNU1_9PLEO|nr:hypothetical protein DM02DRAFT_615146 [Periconia macrospinosa]